MRILVLLKDTTYYVCDEQTDAYRADFVAFELPTGGFVEVPVDNVRAVEHFGDRDIEAFRARLRQVEADRG